MSDKLKPEEIVELLRACADPMEDHKANYELLEIAAARITALESKEVELWGCVFDHCMMVDELTETVAELERNLGTMTGDCAVANSKRITAEEQLKNVEAVNVEKIQKIIDQDRQSEKLKEQLATAESTVAAMAQKFKECEPLLEAMKVEHAKTVEQLNTANAPPDTSLFKLGTGHACLTGDCGCGTGEKCWDKLRQYITELCEAGVSVERQLAAANAVVERLREVIDDIEAVACGEEQVAENDTEGMAWIWNRLQKLTVTEAAAQEAAKGENDER